MNMNGEIEQSLGAYYELFRLSTCRQPHDRRINIIPPNTLKPMYMIIRWWLLVTNCEHLGELFNEFVQVWTTVEPDNVWYFTSCKEAHPMEITFPDAIFCLSSSTALNNRFKPPPEHICLVESKAVQVRT